MVDHIDQIIDGTRRRITIGYHTALILVALVVLLIAAITGHLVTSQIKDSNIIGLAERQSMLVHRIPLLLRGIIDSHEEHRAGFIQSYAHAVDEMEQAHQALLYDSRRSDFLGKSNQDWQKIYFQEPLQLDRKVNEFLKHARAVRQLTEQELLPAQADIALLFNEMQKGKLFDALEEVVQHYELESTRRLEFLHNVVLALSIMALVVLAAVALVILKPAIAYVTQAQKRLIELNQLKGDFLANMSHEIRTPMNGIFGMTELLFDSQLNQRQQHYVRTLQNSADHLLGLINDILDFSKLEAGQMKLDPIRFNLLATIEDVLELLAPRAREKNLELLLRYAPGTARFITADPGRIRQVLFNLIGNAVKFTDKGYVMLHVEMLPKETAPDNRHWLRLRVEDTGIGIPEEKIKSLFEKFMQVESGSTRARQGTGLGLAICRNLVRLMGGDVTVTSNPGKGTVFSWQIPISEAGEPLPSIDRQVQLVGKRMLLVDDLAPNRLLYKEALNAAGIECLMAENADEAISILNYEMDNDRMLHAVITDYMMPVIDGLKLTQIIRANERLRSTPVIILTSAGEQGLIKRFDEAGAAAALSKPVSRQQLFDTLVHVLDAASRGEKTGIITAEASTALSAKKLLSREKPLFGTNILLVEDNRVNLEITTEMLHQFGCEVTTAENGKQAIEAARLRPFDLIFMDCQMPEMDGFEAARHITKLKSDGQIAPVPIIALTANALKGDRERCLESGMDDYLSKPMRKANLEAVLLKWLRPRLEKLASMAPSAKPAPLPVIEEESREEAMNSVPIKASDFGIDETTFNTTSEMLGNKLSTILNYYLEDTESYLQNINDALQRGDPAAAVTPAHTLKSSSRQFGINHLADLAARMEAAARSKTKGEAVEDMNSLLPNMRTAFQQARPFLQSMSDAA